MTSNISVYLVPIGNVTKLVVTLSFIVMEAEGSSSLMTIKILRCFTGRFTLFPESELPNSIVVRVVYRLLRNFTSAACAMRRSEFVEPGGGWIIKIRNFRIVVNSYRYFLSFGERT